MPIDTRLNRPNAESEHATETRDYWQHGRPDGGNSRLAGEATGGRHTFASRDETPHESDAEENANDDSPETPDEA